MSSSKVSKTILGKIETTTTTTTTTATINNDNTNTNDNDTTTTNNDNDTNSNNHSIKHRTTTRRPSPRGGPTTIDKVII